MIYEFDDYRSWLKQEIASRIAKNKRFSVTAFARKTDMGQSMLSLILSNKRNLSQAKALSIASLLKLGPQERKYLLLLVQKEKSTDKKQHNALKIELEEIQKSFLTSKRSREQGRPFPAWNYSLLLAATDLPSVDRSVPGLSHYLGLSQEALLPALNLLQQMDLLRFESGQYQFAPEGIKRLPAQIIRQSTWKVCRTILEKALNYFSSNHLAVDTLDGRLVAANPEQIKVANEKIAAFMDELQDILRQGERTTLVQYSMQLFEVK